VIVNEAAKVPHLEYSWNAVIRLTLMDLLGGAMFGSTPRGLNYFWQLYRKGEDPQETEWSSFKKTTYDNPFIATSEIESVKREDPEIIFRQEVLAEFIDDSGGVFRRVQEAAHVTQLDKPLPRHQYLAGVDIASAVDYTVVTVLDAASKEVVYIDRFNRVDYNVLIDRLTAVYKRFKLDAMKIESNSIGQPVIDQIRSRGLNIIPFMTTSATKQTIIQNLQAAFEHGEIGIPDNQVLIGELLSFEARRNASGSFSYSAPEGMHDDMVMSLAIAWDMVHSRGVILFGA
jgi:phage terminase large subunit-like protein